MVLEQGFSYYTQYHLNIYTDIPQFFFWDLTVVILTKGCLAQVFISRAYFLKIYFIWYLFSLFTALARCLSKSGCMYVLLLFVVSRYNSYAESLVEASYLLKNDTEDGRTVSCY